MHQTFREEVRVPGAPEPVGPWTYVVPAGELIFVSGFTALDERGQAAGGTDAGAQARFALDKIRQALKRPGQISPTSVMSRCFTEISRTAKP